MIKLISYYHYKVVKTFEMGECYLRICLLLSFINRFLNKFKIFCYKYKQNGRVLLFITPNIFKKITLKKNYLAQCAGLQLVTNNGKILWENSLSL